MAGRFQNSMAEHRKKIKLNILRIYKFRIATSRCESLSIQDGKKGHGAEIPQTFLGCHGSTKKTKQKKTNIDIIKDLNMKGYRLSNINLS